MLYVVPSTVSVSPSLVHVTLVAGEPVEVQVRVCVSGSYVRLDRAGRAEEKNIDCYNMSKSRLLMVSEVGSSMYIITIVLVRVTLIEELKSAACTR